MATRAAMAAGSASQLASDSTSCIVMRHKSAAAARCNRFETKIAMSPAMTVYPARYLSLLQQGSRRDGGAAA
jgi:hypothetical protein